MLPPSVLPSGNDANVPTDRPIPELTHVDPPADGPSAGSLEDFTADAQDVVSRNEFSTTYDDGEGGNVSEVSPTPVNVKDGAQGWVPIETDLETTGAWSWLGRGGAQVDVHPLNPEFAETSNDENFFRITRGKYTLGFTLQDAAPSTLERDLAPWSDSKNHLEYPDVFPNVDQIGRAHV